MKALQEKSFKRLVQVGLIVVLALTAALRLRLLDIPLERDEGEYAYAGQLLLQGAPPYSVACNMKMPGIYAAYAAIMAVLGQSTRGIHLGLLGVNLATIVFVFLLGKRLLSSALGGLIAAAFFALLSAGQPLYGFTANAEHFVLFFSVPALLLLLRADRPAQLSCSGLLFGMAFMMKQHAAAFIAYAAILVVRQKKPLGRSLAAFAGGVFLPFLAACLLLAAAGTFPNFWFWTFTYAGHYVSQEPLSGAPSTFWAFLSLVTMPTAWIWGLALLGLPCLFVRRQDLPHGLILLGLVAFSFLAICPGWYFRAHYFILTLPAVALLAAKPLLLLGRLAAIPAILLLAHSAYLQRHYLFSLTPEQISYGIYDQNPFPASVAIAEYIKKNSAPQDLIAVIGSEPQIYFYSRRRSATAYIYTYALMEKTPYALKMQKEMISQIEKAAPKFLVLVSAASSWDERRDSEKLIFQWARRYIRDRYRPVGFVDLPRDKPAIMRWTTAAPGPVSQPAQADITIYVKNI